MWMKIIISRYKLFMYCWLRERLLALFLRFLLSSTKRLVENLYSSTHNFFFISFNIFPLSSRYFYWNTEWRWKTGRMNDGIKWKKSTIFNTFPIWKKVFYTYLLCPPSVWTYFIWLPLSLFGGFLLRLSYESDNLKNCTSLEINKISKKRRDGKKAYIKIDMKFIHLIKWLCILLREEKSLEINLWELLAEVNNSFIPL